MADSRCSCGQGNTASGSRETVCIDTMRVLDSCRDRDCYEDVGVYLTPTGQELIDRSPVVRATCATILGTSIGVSEVPFNNGFYQIHIRFYIRLKLESCITAGRTQEFYGLIILEKSVILYGGEGNVTVFRSTGDDSFCTLPTLCSGEVNLPTAVVETVAPIILTVRVACPDTPCDCLAVLTLDEESLPACIVDAFPDGVPTAISTEGNRLLVSVGMFSVVRLERAGQFLISATEYAVPDKECPPTQAEEDPCRMFRRMAFPVGEFNPPSHTRQGRPQKG